MTLEGARLYLVAPLRIAAGTLAELVPELAAAGVDIVQVREKNMEAGELLRGAEPVADACGRAGIPFVVNDRPDIALALGAGVHLGRGDLPVAVARRILGPGAVIGCSTHSEDDIAAVLGGGEAVDYIAVGPVYSTPTKPGRPPTGVALIRHAAESAGSIPWFAIGGIDEHRVSEVIDAGARRVVVVRAVTEARDPVAAAASLRRVLDDSALS